MIRLALALAVLATPAAAMRCAERDHVAAWLVQDHGLRLHSWGLTDAGDMHELFLSDAGHWAIVQTTPGGCSTVVSLPHQHRGRLWRPPSGNHAIPQGWRYEPGTPG